MINTPHLSYDEVQHLLFTQCEHYSVTVTRIINVAFIFSLYLLCNGLRIKPGIEPTLIRPPLPFAKRSPNAGCSVKKR